MIVVIRIAADRPFMPCPYCAHDILTHGKLRAKAGLGIKAIGTALTARVEIVGRTFIFVGT